MVQHHTHVYIPELILDSEMWVGGVWVGGPCIFLLHSTKTYWLCHVYLTIIPWECGVGQSHIFLLNATKSYSTMHALCNPALYHEWEEERWGKGGRAQCTVSGANPSNQCILYHTLRGQSIPYHPSSQCIPMTSVHTIPYHPGGSLGRIPSSPLMVLYFIWHRPLQ